MEVKAPKTLKYVSIIGLYTLFLLAECAMFSFGASIYYYKVPIPFIFLLSALYIVIGSKKFPERLELASGEFILHFANFKNTKIIKLSDIVSLDLNIVETKYKTHGSCQIHKTYSIIINLVTGTRVKVAIMQFMSMENGVRQLINEIIAKHPRITIDCKLIDLLKLKAT
ncbi:MAG: hypothetical protein P4L59_17700 [Desulfosporosinus sp.]|nr:hypothetical protein [Desulfosporosinus sp.]